MHEGCEAKEERGQVKKKKNRKEKKGAESEKVSKGRGKQQANKVFKMALKL